MSKWFYTLLLLTAFEARGTTLDSMMANIRDQHPRFTALLRDETVDAPQYIHTARNVVWTIGQDIARYPGVTVLDYSVYTLPVVATFEKFRSFGPSAEEIDALLDTLLAKLNEVIDLDAAENADAIRADIARTFVVPFIKFFGRSAKSQMALAQRAFRSTLFNVSMGDAKTAAEQLLLANSTPGAQAWRGFCEALATPFRWIGSAFGLSQPK